MGAYDDRVASDDAPADDPINTVAADRAEIASIVRMFFAAFTSGQDCVARLDGLRAAFLPEAVIIRTCGTEPVVYSVDGFIEPRQALLTGGSLVDFREWELCGRTEIFGDIAQHFGGYAKSGVQAGVPFAGRGMKTLQLVRTSQGWRISAAAWDDNERVSRSTRTTSPLSQTETDGPGEPVDTEPGCARSAHMSSTGGQP